MFQKGRDILQAFKDLPSRNVSVRVVASVTCVAKNSTDLEELEENGETLDSFYSFRISDLNRELNMFIYLFYQESMCGKLTSSVLLTECSIVNSGLLIEGTYILEVPTWTGGLSHK